MNQHSASESRTGFHKVTTVMSPLSITLGVISSALIIGATQAPDIWLRAIFCILVVLVIVFYLCVYAYFAIKDPNRLQTEEYNLALQTLSGAVSQITPVEPVLIQISKPDPTAPASRQDTNYISSTINEKD